MSDVKWESFLRYGTGMLFDFFGNVGLRISVSFQRAFGDFVWIIENRDNILAIQAIGYYEREKAKAEAFTKAFEILNKQLEEK
jgi:hypothetical protein